MSGRTGVARPDITQEMRDDACRSIIDGDERIYVVAYRYEVSRSTVKSWLDVYCAKHGIERKRIVHIKQCLNEQEERKRAAAREYARMHKKKVMESRKGKCFDDLATEDLRERALKRAFYG